MATLTRLAWAVEILDVQPDDRILEIGGGHGAAASLICGRLTTGKYVGIDRSAKMTAAATARNRTHVDAGKAEFRTAALKDAGSLGDQFTKIFAVNVNVFWLDSQREFAALTPLMAHGCPLYLFYEPPSATQVRDIGEKLAANVVSYGFSIDIATDEKLLCAVCRVEK